MLRAFFCRCAFKPRRQLVHLPPRVQIQRSGIHRNSHPGKLHCRTYEIRQLDEDGGATPFEIGPALRTKIFQLVSELHHFQGLDLDVHRKIANLGEKTFRWDAVTESNQVKFNYTLNSAATQLLQICEGLARQQELIELLQRRIKYDRLGVNDALLQFENDLSKSVLPEPERALPLLDQIAGDPRFVEIARQRSRALAERIRHSG